METPAELEIHPAPYPSLEVHRAGFPLDHPYLEHCWAPILGPSSVLLLRRTTELWRDAIPATVSTSDFAAQLGLGRGRGGNSPITKTLDRIVRFRFAGWAAPGVLDVYSEVRPLRSRDLSRVPDWTAARHDELLTTHLHQLRTRAQDEPIAPARAGDDDAAAMARRLDEFAVSQTAREHSGLVR
jgi:hypothetical protein